jgi:hypothetical protein
VEAVFHGVTTPDAVVQVPPGRTTAHWRLASHLRDVEAKVKAAITHRCVPLAVTWKIRPDPLQESVLAGETLYRGVGTTQLISPDGKKLRVDMQFDPQFADYLDDAFWEAFDRNSRRVGFGFFWRGTFNFDPPHAGEFELRFTITERGRVRLDKGGVIAPRALFPIGRKVVKVYDDIGGELPGGTAADTIALRRGVTRAPFLRLPKLGSDACYTGELVCRDARTDQVLARSRLEVDTRLPRRSPEAVRQVRQRRIRDEVQRLFDHFALTPSDVERLESLVGQAKSAGVADKDAERWYITLTLRRPAPRAAMIAGVETMLDHRARHDGGELGAAVRAELVWAQLARAELLHGRGDIDEAWQAFHAAGILDPKGVGREPVELRLLLAEAKWVKALRLASKLLKRRPDDHGLALARLLCYRRLGWRDRVAETLLTWTDRFPRKRDELFALAATAALRAPATNGRPDASGTKRH